MTLQLCVLFHHYHHRHHQQHHHVLWCGQPYFSTALCSATECSSPAHILLPLSLLALIKSCQEISLSIFAFPSHSTFHSLQYAPTSSYHKMIHQNIDCPFIFVIKLSPRFCQTSNHFDYVLCVSMLFSALPCQTTFLRLPLIFGLFAVCPAVRAVCRLVTDNVDPRSYPG